MQSEADVSAIVVTYHSGEVLRACLDNLLASPNCGEIILVNNGNPDIVIAALLAWTQREPRLKLISGHGNIGFGSACNLGARSARYPILLFVNPDCLVEAGTLAEMARLTESPRLTLVGGHICDENGHEQRGARRGKLSLWSAWVSFLGLGRPTKAAGIWRDFNRTGEPLPLTPEEIPVVSGALMATRAADFQRVGGFDEAYFLHVEDIDLCHRYGLLGGQVIFAPGARAIHIGGTSQIASWRVEMAKLRSFLLYFWKFSRSPLDYVGVFLTAPCLAIAVLGRLILRK